MTADRFNEILKTTLDKCADTLCVKASEYATEDRLHNFKVAAKIQNCTPITALAGMMAKHTVSVYDLIQRQEKGFNVSEALWNEKIGDSINYLILLSALVQEKRDEETEGASCKPCTGTNVDALIEYMKDENVRLAKWKENMERDGNKAINRDSYSRGKCAGATELARTVSLYLGIYEDSEVES